MDRIPMAGDPAAAHHEADEPPGDAVAGRLLERGTADEVAGLVELHDAGQVRLERVRLEIELVPVERHAGLEPERVPGAQPDRRKAVRGAGGHHSVPELPGPARVDEDLEPVLAGVAGPGDEGRNAGDGPLGNRVVAQVV